MTLRTRILFGYGIAMTLFTVVLVMAILALVPLGDATDSILKENYRSISAADQMLASLQEEIIVFLAQGEDVAAQMRTLDAAFLSALSHATANITIYGESPLVSKIRTRYDGWRAFILDRREGARVFPAGRIIGADARDIIDRVQDLRNGIIQLRKLNTDHMHAASAEAKRLADRAVLITVIPGFSGLTLILLFSLVLSRRLVHPIRAMSEAAREISAGKLEIRLPENPNDELGELAREFNRMSVELQRFRDLNIEEVIAARKQSDAVLSSIDDGIVLIDTDMNATQVNPAAIRLLGDIAIQPHPLPTLQRILPVAELNDAVRSALVDGIVMEQPDEQRIFQVPRSDPKRYCQYSVELIRNPEDVPIGAVIVLRDVTRLKEVEHLKSEFVMAASHELRTPLTSIGMSIELLNESLSEFLTDRTRGLIGTAREELVRLRTLVSDLLDLSKIESGRITMVFEEVSLNPLVERILAIFRSQCEAKNVSLHWVENEIPPLRADASKIALVLTNLVSNALRYVPDNGNIWIDAHVFGQSVHIRVRDDGPGIPREYQSRIFERFMQAPGSGGGSGLGLAISKEIVKAHGGIIWVESDPDAGSCFTFTLPTS
ncbi:MAG: HAMP domain-containing protein [Bacteroidetes bacterium]|nr:HAMP domain-containing protein [Bacteroidota bacterium]